MSDLLTQALLVEGDEDDYVVMAEHLCRVPRRKFELDWVSSYSEAVVEAGRNCHDLCIFDHRLGLDNGIDLIHEVRAHGCTALIIMLTRYCDRHIETKAREAGVADFLLKHDTNAETLERAIMAALAGPQTP